MRKQSFLLAGLVFFCALAAHAEWRGRVVSVYDGDTLIVSNEGRGEIVRLAGVDAPERDQPFGLEAKRFCADMVGGKMVRVLPHGDVDTYKVYVGELCLNEELLRSGYAWYDPRSGADQGFATLEETARSARRGLWADENPIPPWRFKAGTQEEESAGGSVSIKLPGVHRSSGGDEGGSEPSEQPPAREGAQPPPPAPVPKAPAPSN